MFVFSGDKYLEEERLGHFVGLLFFLKWKVKVKSLSRVLLFATPWTVDYQAPQSMEFSRQEYWSGVPNPPVWASVLILLFYYPEEVKQWERQ